jgi:acyl-coenzyme A synthetase/AMP-(fatty) acid ligase
MIECHGYDEKRLTERHIKALFISPRNNKASQISLFEATDCHWFCYATEFEKTAQILLAERPMRSWVALTIQETLNPEIVPVIPYTKSYEEARDDPCLVLHSSGSTGTPKPIIIAQQLLCQVDAYHNYAEWEGHQFFTKTMMDISDLDLTTSKSKHICTGPWFNGVKSVTDIGRSPAQCRCFMLLVPSWCSARVYTGKSRPLCTDRIP